MCHSFPPITLFPNPTCTLLRLQLTGCCTTLDVIFPVWLCGECRFLSPPWPVFPLWTNHHKVLLPPTAHLLHQHPALKSPPRHAHVYMFCTSHHFDLYHHFFITIAPKVHYYHIPQSPPPSLSPPSPSSRYFWPQKKKSYSLFSCNNWNKCAIPVNSDVFGDPCPGTSKFLEVSLRCVTPERKYGTSCDGAWPETQETAWL